jgi:hypothetical protein
MGKLKVEETGVFFTHEPTQNRSDARRSRKKNVLIFNVTFSLTLLYQPVFFYLWLPVKCVFTFLFPNYDYTDTGTVES